jgi:tyrosyl-tRNA synthetase
MSMDSSFDLLVERGFVHQSSNDEALRAALRRPITLYNGYDATATSLHIGHLITIMMLSHLQQAGHRPIAVIGGGTTMVGDPSGKTESRPMLSRDEIGRNAEAIKRQLGHYVDFDAGRALMVDNADWLLELRYVDFLREIGRHFSVNQLLQHETYRERLQGSGLSFIELNYALVQAYDFLHLYREYDCRLQTGGSDQWFNILAGTELIRRAEGGEAFALVTPLLATASGAKMGKTAAGAVWLDPARTSPYDFYQYWVNVEDADVGRFLRIFTFLPEDEIRCLESLEGAELRAAKEVLAFEVTSLRDGKAEAEKARAAARALFGPRTQTVEVSGVESRAQVGTPTVTLDAVPTTAVPRGRLIEGLDVSELLVLGELAGSRREAVRLIEQGGVSLGDRRVASATERVTTHDVGPDGLLLRVGRKRYRRVVADS